MTSTTVHRCNQYLASFNSHAQNLYEINSGPQCGLLGYTVLPGPRGRHVQICETSNPLNVIVHFICVSLCHSSSATITRRCQLVSSLYWTQRSYSAIICGLTANLYSGGQTLVQQVVPQNFGLLTETITAQLTHIRNATYPDDRQRMLRISSVAVVSTMFKPSTDLIASAFKNKR
jgi:hypothetical protein